MKSISSKAENTAFKKDLTELSVSVLYKIVFVINRSVFFFFAGHLVIYVCDRPLYAMWIDKQQLNGFYLFIGAVRLTIIAWLPPSLFVRGLSNKLNLLHLRQRIMNKHLHTRERECVPEFNVADRWLIMRLRSGALSKIYTIMKIIINIR